MTNLQLPSNLLAIMAHEDDEVGGCGGLLIKNQQLEGDSHVICFGGSDPKRAKEFEAACKLMGVSSHQLLGYSEQDYDQNKLERIIQIRDIILRIKPDYVLTHRSAGDYHLNHQTVSEIVKRSAIMANTAKEGVRVKGILYTETHSLHSVVHELVDVSDVQESIEQALLCHESQISKNDGYYLKLISKRNSLRGLQNGTHFAEAYQFEPLELVGNFHKTIK
ncbi:hypothetical protein HOE37_05630 [Candidatus Woesearchaeota archaeon]|jgi:LmbE family N-acetylglucosaminyl deacetylase|nr:hypothetical protein [Candidatus Woesearchaeota archaeon]MBT4111313.1 hypothetical protein [Candidatus Woesearchaeota archaeon]MBT4335776.1 hypothetical protein [Candidatus Woesearchaeota archaeon]MBT4469246.1 hypothetical protein [Candidatus Woesearchaeota archaeon]MBT6744411.1 hypothetical protein [Candidatus Woesearchaeota archaeon]